MQNLYHNDCLEQLKLLEDNSVDSLVTDPPAGISFMNKSWDDDKGGRDSWVAYMAEIFKECLRVLKPGAHGLVWGLPRTSHWTATALEDAGFEVRDVVHHIFGTGFPKSLNVGNGIGTALKPATEHWVLVRKPIGEKTVAANVLKHGTGGLNIEASKVGAEIIETRGGDKFPKNFGTFKTCEESFHLGRFPANVTLDEFAAELLDEQSGILKSGSRGSTTGKTSLFGNGSVGGTTKEYTADSGGASRFFYVAKASKKDKGASNTHPTVKATALMEYLIKLVTPENGTVLDPFMGSGSTGVACRTLGLKFIGIEKEEEYFEIAKARVA